MLKEFKEFAMKGNVMDLAVGVIIGTAFGKIVTSLVEDVIMPLFGLLVGKVDFSNRFFTLSGQSYPTLAEAKKMGAATLNYGLFINNIVNFLIIALALDYPRLAEVQVARSRCAAPAIAARDSAHRDSRSSQIESRSRSWRLAEQFQVIIGRGRRYLCSFHVLFNVIYVTHPDQCSRDSGS